MAMLLLPAGESSLDIYGDASFLDGAAVGTWAYRIPALGMWGVGMEGATGSERLELMAAVKGMVAAAAVDASARAIHIYTDCAFVVSVLSHLPRRQDLPPRASFDRGRDLYGQAVAALRGRKVQVFQVQASNAHHRVCHREARRHLAEQVCKSERLSHHVALKRAEQKMAALLSDRKRLERQLEETAQRMAIAEVELRALQQFRIASLHEPMVLFQGRQE